MSDNTKLIAEAKNYEGDNGAARWPTLITDLATSLEASDAELARLHAVIAEAEARIHAGWGSYTSVNNLVDDLLDLLDILAKASDNEKEAGK